MSDVAREWRIGDLNLTDYPYSVLFGADHGAPEATAEPLPSFLVDGDLEVTARRGNRTITLQIGVEGTDLADVAANARALDLECDKALNTLLHDPGDGFGEPYQFTVFRTSPTLVANDDYEQACFRVFEVVWRALPWPESVTEVSATLTTSSVGSVKQRVGTFTPAGSASSRGSLSVEHASQGLGEVLLYTGPANGVVPALRPYRLALSGTSTSDSNAVSGFYDTLNPGSGGGFTAYDIPVADVPEGEYAVIIRGRSVTSTSNLYATVAPFVGTTIVGSANKVGQDVAVTASGLYAFYRLGIVRLPSIDTSGSSLAKTRVIVFNTTIGVDFRLDETYLFNLTTGRLSQFACGGLGPSIAGGPNNRVWVDSPSVANDGRGLYLMGTQADRSDAYSTLEWAMAASVHEFSPEGTMVFEVATNVSSAPAVTYRYRPTGHSSVYSGA